VSEAKLVRLAERLIPALVLGEEEIDTFTAGLETALRDST